MMIFVKIRSTVHVLTIIFSAPMRVHGMSIVPIFFVVVTALRIVGSNVLAFYRNVNVIPIYVNVRPVPTRHINSLPNNDAGMII